MLLLTLETIGWDLLPLLLESLSWKSKNKKEETYAQQMWTKQKHEDDSLPSHCRDDLQNRKPWILAILLASENPQGFPETKQNKRQFY